MKVTNPATPSSKSDEAAAAGNKHALYDLSVMSGKGEHWEDYKRRAEEISQSQRDMFEKFDGPKTLVAVDTI
jgi:hypothetical protein